MITIDKFIFFNARLLMAFLFAPACLVRSLDRSIIYNKLYINGLGRDKKDTIKKSPKIK